MIYKEIEEKTNKNMSENRSCDAVESRRKAQDL